MIALIHLMVNNFHLKNIFFEQKTTKKKRDGCSYLIHNNSILKEKISFHSSVTSTDQNIIANNVLSIDNIKG